MDDILKNISGSLDSTIDAISKIIDLANDDAHPVMIQELMKQNNIPVLEGVSLLTLKNNSLISYLQNLVLILLAKLQDLDEESNGEINNQRAVENSIVQRVTLEKGIKPLEKRLSYQLEKMIRSYKRTETEEEETREKLSKVGEKGEEDEEEDDEDEDGDDSDSEDDDNLAYKPDVQALAKLAPNSKSTKQSSSASTLSGEKYKPPKISAIEPPKPTSASTSKASNRKLQSMEEYLKENSDQPMLESSIGSTIVDHGKGGVKTSKDKEREREIQTYEENNFTRLPNAATKKSYKQRQSEMVNNFGGEDWSIFNNKRDVSESTSRKRKPNTAWDRVKKRRQ